jgi:hypothetical protein
VSAASVAIMLCVNDPDSGRPAGYLLQVDVADCELESPYLDGGPVFRELSERGQIQVGRRRYPVTSYREHVGNWCWDLVTMSADHARRLVRHLIAWGFTVTLWTDGQDIVPREP